MTGQPTNDERIRPVCIRGCRAPRRHIFIEHEGRVCGEECHGCLPKEAEYGRLCFECHKRLKLCLKDAPGQHAILLADTAPSVAQGFHAQTEARVGPVWRTDDNQPSAAMYAKPHAGAAQEGEPIRLLCLDVAQELSDWLSQLVEKVCDDYAMTGPPKSLSAKERDPGHCGHPPWKFEVVTACAWLTEQIERVEWYDSIGDDLEDFKALMSQAHALRPWRLQEARVPGVPCPNCHRTTLVRYGGEEDVECQTLWCRSVFDPHRYGIWVRMLHEDGSVEHETIDA